MRALLALLALAACARGPAEPRPEPRPVTAGEAECRAEARRAPEMRAVLREVNPGNPENLDRLRTERLDIENRLVADCLRARGQPTPGGVEPIRRFF